MGFFGGAGGGEVIIPTKSIIRLNWQQNENSLQSRTYTKWNETPAINQGDLFVYHYSNDADPDYSSIEITRDAICVFYVQLGSQGEAWGGASLVTSLLGNNINDTDSITDVIYELPVPDSGSLFPTSTAFVRPVFTGENYGVTFDFHDAELTQNDINILSSWSIVEL